MTETMKRRRLTQTDPLKDWATDIRAQTLKLKPGREQDDMLSRARKAGVAAHLDDWASSAGLKAPT